MSGLAAGLFLVVLFLAYANGANDNFKGVATLFGSRTTNYRRALGWATATTFAGSCAALFLSAGLLTAFSGRGLVPAFLTQEPAFLLAVGVGASLTVALATAIGMPISTTHALTGALVGAGTMAVGSINLNGLVGRFFLPLAISPLASFFLTGALYPAFRTLRVGLGVERQMCLCIDSGLPQPVRIQNDGTAVLKATGLALKVGQLKQCVVRYQGRVCGIDAQRILDGAHFVSAGAVSFARGLNDTPKIVALLAAGKLLGLSLPLSLAICSLAMAAGGLLSARRVATTMSERITAMNHGQGFTANLVTSFLVLMASRWGLPVSTTHISCGSLFGLGAVTAQARWATIRSILLVWVVTLPTAALLAGATFWLVVR